MQNKNYGKIHKIVRNKVLNRNIDRSKFPKTWSLAKEALKQEKLLSGFLTCLNPSAFKVWCTTVPLAQESTHFELFLNHCWQLYYAEFGPWGTWFGRIDIPKPDS